MHQTREHIRKLHVRTIQEQHRMQRIDNEQQRAEEKCAFFASCNYHSQNNEMYNPQGTYLCIDPHSMPTVFDDHLVYREFEPTQDMCWEYQHGRTNSQRHDHIHPSGDVRLVDDDTDTQLPWHGYGIYDECGEYYDMMNLGPPDQPVVYPPSTHNLPNIEQYSATEEAFVHGLLSVSPRHRRCGE
jgi:hypothetical protein